MTDQAIPRYGSWRPSFGSPEITRDLLEIAAELCDGRAVPVLEGDYNPLCLASSCAAHVRELQNASAAIEVGFAADRVGAVR